MQENSNLNRKNKPGNKGQENTVKSETMILGNTHQPGKQKDEKTNQSSNKREDAIDVLTYMSFKL
jgi:hypothetical protein